MEFKMGLKYSLIFILLTEFLSKLSYVILDIQDYQKIGFLEWLFNPITFGIVFIITLIFAYKAIMKKFQKAFNTILIVSLFVILITYSFQFLNGWLFYYVNEIIHGSLETKNEGLNPIITSVNKIFNIPHFSIINDLIINHYIQLVHSLKSMDWVGLIISVFNSKIILTTITIFYFSLFYLFEKFNRKGIDALIPIKNNVTLLSITKQPVWWILPICIPFIRLLPLYFINKRLSEKWGKNAYFAIGMTLLPWFFYGKLILNQNTINNDPV